MAMNEKKEKRANQGSQYEGRDIAYMDIDRMINEGMSGGSVHMRHDTTNIEEARDIAPEQPPYEAE